MSARGGHAPDHAYFWGVADETSVSGALQLVQIPVEDLVVIVVVARNHCSRLLALLSTVSELLLCGTVPRAVLFHALLLAAALWLWRGLLQGLLSSGPAGLRGG